MGPRQVLPLRVRIDLEAVTMKISQISKAGTSQSDYLISYQDTHCENLTPLQRRSGCILQLQPTGLMYFGEFIEAQS